MRTRVAAGIPGPVERLQAVVVDGSQICTSSCERGKGWDVPEHGGPVGDGAASNVLGANSSTVVQKQKHREVAPINEGVHKR